MKKRLAILAVIILAMPGVILILNPQGPPPGPALAIGFLGFTNSRGFAHALFAISNHAWR